MTLLLLTACGNDTAESDHGHDHGASVVVTRWTDSLEVFIEHEQPAHPGPVSFTVHLTRLADWSPVSAGTVVLYVRRPDGSKSGTSSDQTVRPGIFQLRHEFPAQGEYALTLVFRSGSLSDTCVLPPVTVGAAAADGATDAESDEGGISYLKEQQWKEGFATERVARRPVTTTLNVSGVIEAPGGRIVEISAPVNGTILADRSRPLPAIGSAVTAGGTLAVLSPDPGNVNGLAQVRAEYMNAKADFERAQRLFDRGAVAEKRRDEARLRYESAQAGYELLRDSKSWGSDATDATLRIRTPISGHIERVLIRAGQYIAAGQPLFVVADPSRLLLRANVPAAHAAALQEIRDAWFTVEGFERSFRISELGGRTVARGRVVDAATRTIQVAFEFNNPGGVLPIGLFADTRLETGRSDTVITVPRSALVDEGDNVRVVYVQTGGESFARRPVTVGRMGETHAEVISGLAVGERVVHVGAQRVRLASMAGSVPEHGHTH